MTDHSSPSNVFCCSTFPVPQPHLVWALMQINHFIKVPGWTGVAQDREHHCMFQWEEGAQNTKTHSVYRGIYSPVLHRVYRGICSPVCFLIWGDPALSWAFHYSQSLFVKGTSSEVRMSFSPLCLQELVVRDAQWYKRHLKGKTFSSWNKVFSGGEKDK